MLHYPSHRWQDRRHRSTARLKPKPACPMAARQTRCRSPAGIPSHLVQSEKCPGRRVPRCRSPAKQIERSRPQRSIVACGEEVVSQSFSRRFVSGKPCWLSVNQEAQQRHSRMVGDIPDSQHTKMRFVGSIQKAQTGSRFDESCRMITVRRHSAGARAGVRRSSQMVELCSSAFGHASASSSRSSSKLHPGCGITRNSTVHRAAGLFRIQRGYFPSDPLRQYNVFASWLASARGVQLGQPTRCQKCRVLRAIAQHPELTIFTIGSAPGEVVTEGDDRSAIIRYSSQKAVMLSRAARQILLHVL